MAEKASRVEALEKRVNDLEARNADADERIQRLTQILKAFDRARFGRRSEKLGAAAVDDEQHAFVFEEIETGIAAIQAQVTKGSSNTDSKRAPRPRKSFAPHLERIEVVIEPEELPEHAGKQKILIGADVSERLDVVAAKFRVIVTRRPKYAFRNEDGVILAAAPPHIIEGGIPTEALLAQIAVSKTLPQVSGKSKLAEDLRYAISRRDVFERFLTDGRIEIDSNIVERAIRPQTIIRKNSLFAFSDGGGRTWATIATLLQTAKMNTVDPQAWLTQTLERLASLANGWPAAISTPPCHGTTEPERPQLAAYAQSLA